MSVEKITWKCLPSLDLSEVVRAIVMKSWADPPVALRESMILDDAAVDHVALAVPSKKCVLEVYEELVAMGGRVIDPPKVWPDDYECDVQIDARDRKFMASVHKAGIQVTLLAPMSVGDLIWNSLRRAGGSTVHHLAVSVTQIHDVLRGILQTIPTAHQFSPVAVDELLLSQVFIKLDGDPRLLELVQRQPGWEKGFTCSNIKVLSAGERRSFDAEQK